MDYSSFDTVLFDLDGTILDSMDYWYHSPSTFLKYHNIPVDYDIDSQMLIFTWLPAAKELRDKYFKDKTSEEVYQMILDWVDSTYPYIEEKKEVITLLKLFKAQGKKIILFTGTESRLYKPVMKIKKLNQYFDYIISCWDETVDKGDGTAFDYLIANYNINPQTTLIVEDSLSSIKQAVSRGMTALAIKDSYNLEEQKEIAQYASFLY